MSAEPDTLYYDGSCPLCSAEMDRLSRHKNTTLQLVDVHDLRLPADQKAKMLTELHLQRADGEVITGLDANVAAWQHTRWGVLFRWLRWPLVRTLADAIYRTWAVRRYDRLYRQSPTRGPHA